MTRSSGGSPHSALCDSDKCPCYREGARYDESWIDDDLYREAPGDITEPLRAENRKLRAVETAAREATENIVTYGDTLPMALRYLTPLRIALEEALGE